MKHLIENDFETFVNLLKIRKDEMDYHRIPLEFEVELLKNIENGQYQLLEEQSFTKIENLLMENGIEKQQRLQFALVAAITLFSRAALSGGLAPDEVFSISDGLLHYVSIAKKTGEFDELFRFSAIYFAKKVNSSKQKNTPHHVKKICNYISDNIFQKITIADLAKYTNLSPNYMCKLFNMHMGITLHNYIQREKIEIACRFLSQTDVSVLDIATYLGFKTVSNFSIIFKKWKNMTPSDFRKTYYQNVI